MKRKICRKLGGIAMGLALGGGVLRRAAGADRLDDRVLSLYHVFF